MANRLPRDTIINRALDMIDSATLDHHDRPSAPTIVTTAYAIGWLQDAIDAFYHEFPWTAQITTASLSLTAASESPASYSAPATFLWDVRNGIIVTTGTRKRLLRKPLQELLSMATGNQTAAAPEIYSVVNSTIYVHPRPDQTYTATLWYYSFPAVLATSSVPVFPTDLVLIDYVRLRGMEQIRALPPGSAQQYIRAEIQALREGSMGREPESSELPSDPLLNIQQAGGKAQLTRQSASMAPRGAAKVGV
jgi:hypothetical protein